MPHEIEATATSRAAPDVIFKHLCVAESWDEWGGFWVRAARREAAGTEHPNGVGAVRRVRPRREEVVAWDPPRHYGYVVLTGPPPRGLRADVTLEPHAAGMTLIRWRGAFDGFPGTGPFTRAVLRRRLRAYARRVALHAERCEPGCPARLPGAL
ncbi:SRPBCC family protein [Actinomadura chibensis]|uniref:SRPBCC family protein n=1 Tax=Actinomadura chibensis TaxID=392828 RepID=A0A5D0NW69_9ACTN|nr:SRPBCC family protein [Actinomadura chibensis]TYB48469.1 SRPBCC family protein [Actinomadura chibensis]